MSTRRRSTRLQQKGDISLPQIVLNLPSPQSSPAASRGRKPNQSSTVYNYYTINVADTGKKRRREVETEDSSSSSDEERAPTESTAVKLQQKMNQIVNKFKKYQQMYESAMHRERSYGSTTNSPVMEQSPSISFQNIHNSTPQVPIPDSRRLVVQPNPVISSSGVLQPPVKRGRGRPRKYPLNVQRPTNVPPAYQADPVPSPSVLLNTTYSLSPVATVSNPPPVTHPGVEERQIYSNFISNPEASTNQANDEIPSTYDDRRAAAEAASLPLQTSFSESRNDSLQESVEIPDTNWFSGTLTVTEADVEQALVDAEDALSSENVKIQEESPFKMPQPAKSLHEGTAQVHNTSVQPILSRIESSDADDDIIANSPVHESVSHHHSLLVGTDENVTKIVETAVPSAEQPIVTDRHSTEIAEPPCGAVETVVHRNQRQPGLKQARLDGYMKPMSILKKISAMTNKPDTPKRVVPPSDASRDIFDSDSNLEIHELVEEHRPVQRTNSKSSVDAGYSSGSQPDRAIRRPSQIVEQVNRSRSCSPDHVESDSVDEFEVIRSLREVQIPRRKRGSSSSDEKDSCDDKSVASIKSSKSVRERNARRASIRAAKEAKRVANASLAAIENSSPVDVSQRSPPQRSPVSNEKRSPVATSSKPSSEVLNSDQEEPVETELERVKRLYIEGKKKINPSQESDSEVECPIERTVPSPPESSSIHSTVLNKKRSPVANSSKASIELSDADQEEPVETELERVRRLYIEGKKKINPTQESDSDVEYLTTRTLPRPCQDASSTDYADSEDEPTTKSKRTLVSSDSDCESTEEVANPKIRKCSDSSDDSSISVQVEMQKTKPKTNLRTWPVGSSEEDDPSPKQAAPQTSFQKSPVHSSSSQKSAPEKARRPASKPAPRLSYVRTSPRGSSEEDSEDEPVASSTQLPRKFPEMTGKNSSQVIQNESESDEELQLGQKLPDTCPLEGGGASQVSEKRSARTVLDFGGEAGSSQYSDLHKEEVLSDLVAEEDSDNDSLYVTFPEGVSSFSQFPVTDWRKNDQGKESEIQTRGQVTPKKTPTKKSSPKQAKSPLASPDLKTKNTKATPKERPATPLRRSARRSGSEEPVTPVKTPAAKKSARKALKPIEEAFLEKDDSLILGEVPEDADESVNQSISKKRKKSRKSIETVEKEVIVGDLEKSAENESETPSKKKSKKKSLSGIEADENGTIENNVHEENIPKPPEEKRKKVGKSKKSSKDSKGKRSSEANETVNDSKAESESVEKGKSHDHIELSGIADSVLNTTPFELDRLPEHFLKDLAEVRPHSKIRSAAKKLSKSAGKKSKNVEELSSSGYIPLSASSTTKFGALALSHVKISRIETAAEFKMRKSGTATKSPMAKFNAMKKKRMFLSQQ